MFADFYIPRTSNDIKVAVQNHLKRRQYGIIPNIIYIIFFKNFVSLL